MELTQKRLKEILHYDPEAGIFHWKERINPSINIDNNAGWYDAHGYLSIRYCRKSYKLHRMAWLYIHGEFPKHDIDHINGIRDDNRICNLRSVTRRENLKNRCISSNNTSGVLGVHLDKRCGRYEAYIHKDSKKISLGRFDGIHEATEARKKAEIEYGFHENHGRVK